MALPKNLIFTKKENAPYAKSYRTSIYPENQTNGFALGDTLRINIPTRMGLHTDTLNSCLKFTTVLTPNSANTSARLDSCGAHGYIQRIRIFHGSNMLEEIVNYGEIVKMLYDLQIGFGTNYGKNNVLSGTRNDLVVNSVNNNQVQCVNSGEMVFDNVANTNAVSRTYLLNLVSILGCLTNQNYFPNYALTSAPITLEITFVSAINQALACASPTIVFNSVEYIANFVELNPSAMEIVYRTNANGNRIEMNTIGIRNYVSVANGLGAGSQLTIPIPAKFTSLKSILASQRSSTGTALQFPYSSISNSVVNYQFRVGSNLMPSKPIDNSVEQFLELIKCFGSAGDINYSPNIDLDSFTLSANVNNAVATRFSSISGSWYVGLDLEQYPNTDRMKLYAGYDSRTDDIFLNVTYSSAGAPTITGPRWDIYSLFDQTLICEYGTGYTQF